MKFSLYQDSVIGGRSVNQDRMGYSYTRDSLILVLADGMGGHLKGEVAAQLALQAIGALFQMYAKPAIANPLNFLDEALRRAHREILRYQPLLPRWYKTAKLGGRMPATLACI
jgi:PPM family protein phosphatase